MTFAQNWLIMMKVVMVGADDSGLRSTGDDGDTDYDVPITFSSMDVSL